MPKEPQQGSGAAASELIVCPNDTIICDSYIFEPSANEESLGSLYVVGETNSDNGIGRELLDLTVQALQKEYYRDESRGILPSFESALHQANLILHDTAEAGVRSWMERFNVAVGVLAQSELHISSAGEGHVYLARGARASQLSQDLSRSPITNPLRAFAQVASGTVRGSDTLYFGTGALGYLFRLEDFTRFAIERQPETITTRLKQLYDDQGATEPLGALVVSFQPSYQTISSKAQVPPDPVDRDKALPKLNPRQPLVIRKSFASSVIHLISTMWLSLWGTFKAYVWPLLVRGGRSSGRAVVKAGGHATRQARQAATQGWRKIQQPRTNAEAPTSSVRLPALPVEAAKGSGQKGLSLFSGLATGIRTGIQRLPTSSKMLAALSVVLVVILVVSVVLLQRKQASEADVQASSEQLYGAQTKLQAAENALIYDNRERSRELLAEAKVDVASLEQNAVYEEERLELAANIQALEDRIARIVRLQDEVVTEIGDFSAALPESKPLNISLVGDSVYTFDPSTNKVAVIAGGGAEPSLVSESTEGVGFFAQGESHAADKQIVFATTSGEFASFDTKDNSIAKQEVTLPSAESSIASFALYGSRLYMYDPVSSQIYSYSKDLTGYSGAASWIADSDFPRDTIKDITIDGSIYTLHEDGSVRELFRGNPTDLKVEEVSPSLSGATKILTNENMAHLYVFDPAEQRVVILDKTDGTLVRQVTVASATELKDVVVSDDETALYLLDNTRVLRVLLRDI